MGECCTSRRPFWNGIGRSICPRWWRQPEPFSRIRCSVTLLNVCFTRPKCTASSCCPAFAMLSTLRLRLVWNTPGVRKVGQCHTVAAVHLRRTTGGRRHWGGFR